jgi:hypothetical protein
MAFLLGLRSRKPPHLEVGAAHFRVNEKLVRLQKKGEDVQVFRGSIVIWWGGQFVF